MSTPDWHDDHLPAMRAGPPWIMQEMIAAQPVVVEQLLREPPDETAAAADAIAGALQRHQPVTICGCGTSEHAAHAIAGLLSAAAGPQHAALVQAKPSLTAALAPLSGVCVAVSHDGGTRATALALDAARSTGARAIAITQQADSSVAQAADLRLLTSRHDESWCHTIAYTSAIATGAALAARLGRCASAPDSAGDLLERASTTDAASSIAGRLAASRIVLCAGAHTDHVSARELALKIAEGARMGTLALELETVLHGQLAGQEPADALVLIAITDHPGRDRVARRASHVARAAAAIGLPVAALLSEPFDEALDPDLTPAGRMVLSLPSGDRVDHRLAGLLAGAGALQSLTLELAHARHTNPDLIRREQEPYRRAALAGEGSADW